MTQGEGASPQRKEAVGRLELWRRPLPLGGSAASAASGTPPGIPSSSFAPSTDRADDPPVRSGPSRTER